MHKSDKSSKDAWNDLAGKAFNTEKNYGKTDQKAADNILIAWPIILEFIKKNTSTKQSKRALDFGCGTGSFCKQLNDLGFNTTGIDYAETMIKIAKSKIDKKIRFHHGDSSKALEISNTEGKFDVIVSIMVFQFIEDIESTIKDLISSINKKGLVCFAVFNRDWVKKCYEKNIRFKKLKKSSMADELIMDFEEGNKVKVYNRDAKTYNDIFEKRGLKQVILKYPPFTKEYIKKYSTDKPTDIPEFMILGYQMSDLQFTKY